MHGALGAQEAENVATQLADAAASAPLQHGILISSKFVTAWRAAVKKSSDKKTLLDLTHLHQNPNEDFLCPHQRVISSQHRKGMRIVTLEIWQNILLSSEWLDTDSPMVKCSPGDNGVCLACSQQEQEQEEQANRSKSERAQHRKALGVTSTMLSLTFPDQELVKVGQFELVPDQFMDGMCTCVTDVACSP
jgi:hypothetical protein